MIAKWIIFNNSKTRQNKNSSETLLITIKQNVHLKSVESYTAFNHNKTKCTLKSVESYNTFNQNTHLKVYKATTYKISRKGIRKYKNVFHKYSFDH